MLRLSALLLLASTACAAPHIAGITSLNNRLIVATGADKESSRIYSCEVTADAKLGTCSPLKLEYQ